MGTDTLTAGGCTSRPIEADVDSPHVQVILDTGPLPPILAAALHRTCAAVTVRGFEEACYPGPDCRADAVVVVVPSDQHTAAGRIERVLNVLAEQPRGTLVLADRPLNGLASTGHPPGLPISFAVDPSVGELAARLSTICEHGGALRYITEQAEDMKQRGRQIADEVNHLDEQLRLASQVQRDFLPQRVPRCEDVRFLTLFQPADYVSGDIYDISRLDETRIGLAVADVTGHGIPAALLTLFVKRAWRAKEIDGSSYRIIPPNELLERLNRDVLEADLQECQVLSACCAVYDRHDRTITWARGGLPYPILVRPGETPIEIRTRGELLGAFQEPHFELRREQLQPGDTMIFFSDGLEALLLCDAANRRDRLDETAWFNSLGREPIEDHIADIRRRLAEIPEDRGPRDDVTLLAISVEDASPPPHRGT